MRAYGPYAVPILRAPYGTLWIPQVETINEKDMPGSDFRHPEVAHGNL
jgi:hypothetical protein